MIKLKSVKGNILLNDFYYNNKVAKESVIESTFNYWIQICTYSKVKSLKIPCKRGITDGVFEFLGFRNKHIGWGVQEVKRKIKRGSAKYTHQFLQNVAYISQLDETSKIDVIILNSESYFDYIFVNENKELLNTLYNQIKNLLLLESPCNIHKCITYDMSRLKIHRYNIDENFNLKDPLEDIYKHLLSNNE